MKHHILTLLLLSFSFLGFSQEMNNTTLEELITQRADTIEGSAGNWRFAIKDVGFACFTDENNNRMRIISPVAKVAQLDEKMLKNALIANFHTALDVKYAISDDILFSVFIHPLKELTKDQVDDAIIQVYNANITFGTIYSSGALSFPGALKKEPKKKKETVPLLKDKI